MTVFAVAVRTWPTLTVPEIVAEAIFGAASLALIVALNARTRRTYFDVVLVAAARVLFEKSAPTAFVVLISVDDQ